MSIRDAEKAFKAAQADLRAPENRALWNMNAGFLELCSEVQRTQHMLDELDRKIVYLSHQIAQR